MLRKVVTASILACATGMMSGCAFQIFRTSEPVADTKPVPAWGNAEYHTWALAEELFAQLDGYQQYRYAVTGFVPVTSLEFNPNDQQPLMLLGHQLQEGLMTEASKRGLITRDFKVTNHVRISAEADRSMSRDTSQLTKATGVDFFITGTITEQQGGAIVNARIVNVNSKDVVAAATKFFPAELFWQAEQVSQRNGKIYRIETEDRGMQ